VPEEANGTSSGRLCRNHAGRATAPAASISREAESSRREQCRSPNSRRPVGRCGQLPLTFDFRRLAVVALILVSACAGSNAADKPDQPPATETGDSTQSTSPDDETTEPSTTDAAFASYSDLVERAADGDPESVVQLALAETAVILGPLPGVPDVDPGDVDIEVAAGALQVLIGSPDLVTEEQQAAIEGRIAEIDAASTVVYRTLDDPEYLAAVESGPGVDQEAVADVSAVFAAGGALPDLTIQGSADFSYSVSVSKMILSNTEFELSATSTLLRGEPLTLTQDDVGGGNDGTTSFIIRSTDPVLVLENPSGSKGPVYFPAVWFRQ
jgi:hypothetical protein